MATFFSFCAFVLLASASAQVVFPGSCPLVPVVQNFQQKNYSGLWYEIEHYWFIPEILGTCIRVVYVDNGDSTFEAVIKQMVGGAIEWTNPGHTTYLSNDKSGIFNLRALVTQSPIPFSVDYPYMVLDTDYVNFTIKYLCVDLGSHHIKTIWILSRKKGMDPQLLSQIHRFLESYGINTSFLLKSELRTCPPEPGTMQV